MIADGVMTKEEVSAVVNDHTVYLNEQVRIGHICSMEDAFLKATLLS